MGDFDFYSRSSAALKFEPLSGIQAKAHVKSQEQYKKMYNESISDPAQFWTNVWKEFDFYWKEPPSAANLFSYNFDVTKGKINISWMKDGKTNICYNVLDRIVKNGNADKVAFYWEGNDPADQSKITYGELLKEVCKFANVLKAKGVKRGDRVAIYMPMITELVVAMLACARIGGVHNIVFGGFSAASLAERMIDAECKILVTSDGVYRGAKLINLKDISDAATKICEESGLKVTTMIVVRHLSSPSSGATTPGSPASSPVSKKTKQDEVKFDWCPGRDCWWQDEMSGASADCEPEWMGAEDPLFMLYTSGSTGKPKGVLHTVAGYLLYTATTFKYVFDYQPDDVYWCTADIGWITGHSYIVYGPMANGATNVIFEGIPTYPDAGRMWQICDKYKVSKFYTAPTAIRLLMKFGDSFVTQHSRASIKVLGTVGEPINPEAWIWYYNIVGEKRSVVVDTYWQTETGGHVITPLPGATVCKPGSATFPFFGIKPVLLQDDGCVVEGEGEGYLAISQPWPGIMRTVYNNQARFEKTYFERFPGYYMTGDGARRDSEGYIWITGRMDDMLNVSGHLLSTAQVESALVEHPAVVEAAVVAYPHKIKGETTYCFVTLKQGFDFTDDLIAQLKEKVREMIGPFATPDYVQNAPSLPKTRSGKIMRRILRKIAVNDSNLGDTTTLADESVIKALFALRPSMEN